MSVPLHEQSPNEITRDSLVKILEIMYRLAAPESLPELLREIIEVGKVAIVAEDNIFYGLITQIDLINHLRKATM